MLAYNVCIYKITVTNFILSYIKYIYIYVLYVHIYTHIYKSIYLITKPVCYSKALNFLTTLHILIVLGQICCLQYILTYVFQELILLPSSGGLLILYVKLSPMFSYNKLY